jgi:hypothetical protein
MLAPRDDEILLLQIVLSEGHRAALLSMLKSPRRLSHGTCRASRRPAIGLPDPACVCVRSRGVRVISIVYRLTAKRPMITHYGCTIIGGNDMQGEQSKGNNASCLSFAYLPAGGALLYSGLRSVTMTELNTACFGREEWPSQSVLRPFNWEEKKCCLDALF